MSLRDLLRSTRALAHLPALAQELGFEPTWHELAWEALRLPPAAPPPAARLVVVGRRTGLACFALESADAARAARWLAGALLARGQPALVLSLDPKTALLAVVAAAADRPLLTLRLDAPSALELGCLQRGAIHEGESALARALHWAEALSGQGLGRRFFRQFRTTLDGLIAALPRTIPRQDRHALALLQLTRLLFCYFVQAKGCLDGRTGFLREELDRCLARGKRLHRDFLRPLFFGTLNRRPAERSAAVRRLGRVPFLNGGLFEPHPLERRFRFDLPNAVWRDAFDHLFERFHFTLDARDAAGRAIAPDMLGRVFEGVMEPEERRGSGSFYTPSELVDAVLQEGFAAWIGGRLRLPAGEAARRLKDPSPEVLTLLRSAAVLDPAAGSGAFLLGAMRVLVTARGTGGETRAAATRAVLRENLHGVDLNPSAVRLAELRLWLEVIEAESAGPAQDLSPLPNLDAAIRQGDSLIEPLGLPRLAGGIAATRVRALRNGLTEATGQQKRRLLTALRRAELDAAQEGVAQGMAASEGRIRELLSAAGSPGLFGDRQRLDHAGRRALVTLRRERGRLRTLARRLERAEELPWFHYHSQFADVMARGGFDLVVGNPPWVRAETLTPALRAGLKERYQWFRGGTRSGAGGGGFGHLPDLSIAFLERGLGLLRPGGVVALLLPAKLATATYAEAARSELARRTRVWVAADLAEDPRAAFDATVYPLALVAAQQQPPASHRVRTRLGSESAPMIPQSTLGAGPWILKRDALRDALAEVRSSHPILGERLQCHLGVKTGANDVFVDPPQELEPEVLRPAVRGRDVRAFLARSRVRLLWPHDPAGAPLPELPLLTGAYLAPHERRLRARRDYQHGPWWTLFRVGPACAPYRVVWADLARELEAAALVGNPGRELVPLNTCYLIVALDEATALRLAAWLNSTWIRAVAKQAASPAASGFARFNAATVQALPCPGTALTDAELLDLSRRAHEGNPVQHLLDRACARLLGLSASAQAALRAEQGGRG